MKAINEKLQKIYAEKITPSKQKTQHLFEAKVRRNIPEDLLSMKNSLQAVDVPFEEASV